MGIHVLICHTSSALSHVPSYSRSYEAPHNDCRDGAGSSSEGRGDEGAESSIPDSLPASAADTDWREFRARLIAGQAASTSGRPEDQVLFVQGHNGARLHKRRFTLICMVFYWAGAGRQ